MQEAARISVFILKAKLHRRIHRIHRSSNAQQCTILEETNRKSIRPLGLLGSHRTQPFTAKRLKSNAHCDGNNLGVKSSGGSVVIARLKIETIAGLASLDGETNSTIPAQSP